MENIETPELAALRFYWRLTREGYALTRTWCYCNLDGSEMWWVCRFEHPTRKKEIRPIQRVDGEFQPGKPAFRNGSPLLYEYSLSLVPDDTLWIVEGEKACDCAWDVCGLASTTWAGGANAIEKANWGPVTGKDCILWPDNDQSGIDAMKALQSVLRCNFCRVAIVDVEKLGLRPHDDIVDWVRSLWEADPTESTWELRLAMALHRLPLVLD